MYKAMETKKGRLDYVHMAKIFSSQLPLSTGHSPRKLLFKKMKENALSPKESLGKGTNGIRLCLSL